MMRSSLHPEVQPNRLMGPTKYRGGLNQSELTCCCCNEMYFVDDLSFRDAMTAMEMGLESSFYCDDCEAEREELAH